MSMIRLWHRLTYAGGARLLVGTLAAAALLAGAPAAGASSHKHRLTHSRLPVLFVHGFESAGSNFASQAMRFESNGYPTSWVSELDYNSTAATSSNTEVDKQIDEAIAALKQRTGKSQVEVIGHSEGTSVMFKYLTEGEMAAQRKASVARYVNMDGQEANPGVPTLALWAGRCGTATCSKPERHMEGAENVTIPNATHVQTSTSAESFQQVYKFFRGKLPKRDIVPQKGTIQLAGKALEFPQNTGLVGDTVQIWPVNFNGARRTKTPLASIAITDGSEAGGAWGPVAAKPGQRYEFALVKPSGKTIHIYMEPFVRSDYAIRLLGSAPIEADTGKSPKSSGAVMIRYEEYWGNQPGENDELLIKGLNVCTAALCPFSKEVNAFFAFNWEGKEETTLKEEPALSALPFLQAAQVFIPASSPPNAVVSYQLKSRRGGGLRTLNIPNWEATTDEVTIYWNDFEKLTF
jgi:triacylglycerol esterase/lipase EstA (alpha/beta hydrolase family)